ncbi:MAG: HAMP domain-containing protein [Burkholderiaceae bacterium]|nr:HAMP domain-containing protein [Burkholderiaceae bacterium]
MRVGIKLGITFGALAMLVLAIVAVSLRALAADHQQFSDYVGGISQRAQLAGQVREAVDQRAIAARNLVLLAEPAELAAERERVVQAHQRVGQTLAQLRRAVDAAPGVPAEVRALVGEMEAIEARYAPVALAVVELAAAGRREDAIQKMNRDCRPLLASLVASSGRFAEQTRAQSQLLLSAADEGYAGLRRLLLGAGLLATLAAAAAGWWVTRMVTVPIARALRLADAVADGDLSLRGLQGGAAAAGRDEVGQLLQALQRMTGGLQAIVRQVRGSSDSIATGASQVSIGNADLSQRTEQQAAALQRTAASMEQLNATVRLNADHAQQADQQAQEATAVASRAGAVVGEVVLTMQAINQGSQRIGDIVGVIDGIAFQTNILALNAAVEAARAGESGRGFAVVAAEVRALAGRSAAAAREIRQLITASVERVGQGQRLVDQAGSTMGEVVGAIGRVTRIVGQISSASREQSLGVAQVTEAVAQMDQVTQQNAALVEQSAAASESLSDQARQLVGAVARFRLAPA